MIDRSPPTQSNQHEGGSDRAGDDPYALIEATAPLTFSHAPCVHPGCVTYARPGRYSCFRPEHRVYL